MWTIKASLGGGATTLGGGTAISGGGTPDTGCGTLFRPVPAEFNHWLHMLAVQRRRNLPDYSKSSQLNILHGYAGTY